MVLKVYLIALSLLSCTILCNWVFDNFILVEELFAKACVLVNNNLFRKLFLSLESPIIFNESLNVTSVLYLFLILIYLVVN